MDKEERLTRKLLNFTSGERDVPPQEHSTPPERGPRKPMSLTNDFTTVSNPFTENSMFTTEPRRRGTGKLDDEMRRHA
jgi:hypothetical protein